MVSHKMMTGRRRRSGAPPSSKKKNDKEKIEKDDHDGSEWKDRGVGINALLKAFHGKSKYLGGRDEAIYNTVSVFE